MGFLGVSFIHLILVIAGADEGLRHVFGVIGGVFGVALMLYSGVLLAAARPIAFWSTAMLPLLFMLSSVLTGLMGIILIALITGEPFQGAVSSLERFIAVLLVLKTIVVIFYLQSTHRVPESRASAKLVLTGAVAPLFWFGVALLGLAIPLGLGFLDLIRAYGAEPKLVAALAAICGIAGGFFLRQVVLAAGIPAPLRAGRFEVALPII
jgi:formate-dependent nitrite reductase membrane component NrfD